MISRAKFRLPSQPGRPAAQGAVPARLGLVLILACCLLAAATAAWAQTGPRPGIYQPNGGAVTAELRLQPDGSWQLHLWEGDKPGGGGFEIISRLVHSPGQPRLAGIWQSVPGSCCPGRGRLEVALGEQDSFRVAVFTPSVDSAAWAARPQSEFRYTAPLPAPDPLARLAGVWRLSMWYSDLLPGGKPADTREGLVRITVHGQELKAAWENRPGSLGLTPSTGGLHLVYEDAAAGYKLEASLSRQAEGLAYGGGFQSSLGRGTLQLVRRALPADPPGAPGGVGGFWDGLWVDPRTGNDFFSITSSGAGFEFEAYGGSRANPRYLSRGRAEPSGPDSFQARATDADGYCCGNQGKLIFKRVDGDALEVSSLWWPKNRPEPGAPPSSPYRIQRVAGTGPQRKASGWPVIQESTPGLLGQEGGAVKVAFTWRPSGEPRPAALFSQGGYLAELEMYIDAEGRLAARLRDDSGRLISVAAQRPLAAQQPHVAWLVYQAGGEMRLYLDGGLTARADLPRPWAGTSAPYLAGGSRWPGRGFSGSIESVELFRTPQDPESPIQADLTIRPSLAPEEETKTARVDPGRVTLLRLWHPKRLVHAYSADQARLDKLTAQGFVLEGPVGRLYKARVEGGEPLYAHQHKTLGYTLLSSEEQPPEGCETLGLLGYMPPANAENVKPLLRLSAKFPDPLLGRELEDRLYTSRNDQAPVARGYGYGPAQAAGQVLAAEEPALTEPALYNWQGSWRGEGWGRFFLLRSERTLHLFWYYANLKGPHYFAAYELNLDGTVAEGMAVGQPGNKATYYKHRLRFITDDPKGPRVELVTTRLAAPLDDGRLVLFKQPKTATTTLIKTGQQLPPAEARLLRQWMSDPGNDPARAYEQALERAKAGGRLLER